MLSRYEAGCPDAKRRQDRIDDFGRRCREGPITTKDVKDFADTNICLAAAYDSDGNTALINAVSGGQRGNVSLLLAHKHNANVQTSVEGRAELTPLVLAAVCHDDDAMINALLTAGADPSATCGGKSALQWAEAKGHHAVAQALRDHARGGSLQAFLGSWFPLLQADLDELGAEEVDDLKALEAEDVERLAAKLKKLQGAKFREKIAALIG